MAILDTAGGGGWRKEAGGPAQNAGQPMVVRLAKWLAGTAFVIAACFFAGFLVFLWSLERVEPKTVRKADGIVVLTGGVDRIGDAISRLSAGAGKRLLISGVSLDVTAEQLAARAPQFRSWLRCCVDLGHAARNTAGNAKEIRHWAHAKGYRSLLVVTSNYHMPRAMVEMRRQLPDLDLIEAPVVTSKLQDMDFWSHPALLRTIACEYVKFIVASVRAALTAGRLAGETGVTANRRHV